MNSTTEAISDESTGRRSTVLKRWASFALAVLAALWAVARVGPWPVPDLPGMVSRFGQWRDANLPVEANYGRTSLPNQLIYEAFGSRGVWAYLIECAAVAMVAVALLIWWYAREATPGNRARAIRLAILSPVIALLVGFIGGYDPFTVLGFVIMVWAWRLDKRWLLVVAGVFLGFQHFEQALVGVIAATLVALAIAQQDVDRPRRPTIAWALIGVAAGKALNALLLAVVVGDGFGGRTSYLVANWVVPAVKTSIDFLPVLVLSFFAGAWAIVILGFVSSTTRARVLMCAAFAVCLIPMAVAADHTRIFILVSLPSLAIISGWLLSKDESLTLREWRLVEGLAWIVVPILVWTDSVGAGYVQHLGTVDQLLMFLQQSGRW